MRRISIRCARRRSSCSPIRRRPRSERGGPSVRRKRLRRGIDRCSASGCLRSPRQRRIAKAAHRGPHHRELERIRREPQHSNAKCSRFLPFPHDRRRDRGGGGVRVDARSAAYSSSLRCPCHERHTLDAGSARTRAFAAGDLRILVRQRSKGRRCPVRRTILRPKRPPRARRMGANPLVRDQFRAARSVRGLTRRSGAQPLREPVHCHSSGSDHGQQADDQGRVSVGP